MAKFGTFLKESYGELKKVTWPKKDDVVSTTVAVLVVSAIFSIFIYFSDQLLSTAVEYVYRVIGS